MDKKAALTRNNQGPQGLPTDTVPVLIDGVLVDVTVRAMNRGELLMAGKLNADEGQVVMERYVLSSCMIDPGMSETDIDAWFASGPAMEVQPVVQKINKLSGVGQGAAKSALPGDGEH